MMLYLLYYEVEECNTLSWYDFIDECFEFEMFDVYLILIFYFFS